MSSFYILDAARCPVPCDDVVRWHKMLCDYDARLVAKTEKGDVEIISVFIGIDTSLGRRPSLFETAIYRDGKLDSVVKSSTWAEAQADHDEAAARL